MAGNTTNFALVNLKNVYVLSVKIKYHHESKELKWNFLIRKKNNKEYRDLFTNTEVHWLDGTNLVFGLMGEYDRNFVIHFEELTHISDCSSRFKGMDIESFAALSEFINYLNIMSNTFSNDPNITFKL